MEEDENKISKYSSGVNIIIRLDSLWRDTHNAVKNENYYQWNTILDRIWCELARDIKPEEYNDKKDESGKIIKEGYESKFSKFDEELAKYGEIIDSPDNLVEGFGKVPKEKIANRGKQYEILMKKDLFLRRLENHLGKGTTWEDDEDDGFD